MADMLILPHPEPTLCYLGRPPHRSKRVLETGVFSPRKCGAQDVAAAWLARVASEVRGHVAFLGSRGWRFWDIAIAFDCSPRSIVSWRKGAAEMSAMKLERLRALAAEHGRKATGT